MQGATNRTRGRLACRGRRPMPTGRRVGEAYTDRSAEFRLVRGRPLILSGSTPLDSAGILTAEEEKRVEDAIAQAERGTTAEIKVVVLRWCWIDLATKAVEVFRRLGLHRTREHNCVLILVVRANREFFIYGDRGITARVGFDYWYDLRDVMAEHFRAGRMAQGLCEAIALIGSRLAEHYPAGADNPNEIDDAIVHDS